MKAPSWKFSTLGVAPVYGISSADRRLQFAAMGSDMFVSEVFTYLCSGATLVFCLDDAGNSVTEFVRLVDAHRITITGLPSSWWSEWAAIWAWSVAWARPSASPRRRAPVPPAP